MKGKRKKDEMQIYFIKKIEFQYFSILVKKLVYQILNVILRRHFRHYNELNLIAPVIIT